MPMYKTLRPTPRRKVLPILAIVFLVLAALGVVIFGILGADSNPTLPAGSTWGMVPVGGLTPEEARLRVETVFSAPLDLQYLEQTIQVMPQQLGFTLNTQSMLEQASRASQPNFWQRLWNQGQCRCFR